MDELSWKAQFTHGTKIPKPAIMIIGAIITVASVIVNFSTDSFRFTIFIVAGLIAFIYGAIGTFSDKPKTPKTPVKSPHHRPHQVGVHHGAHAVGQHAKRVVSAQRASAYHFCPFCATRIPPHASYCPGCGQQLPG